MAGTNHGCGHSAVSSGWRGHCVDGLVGDDLCVTGGWRGGSPSRCDPTRGQPEGAIVLCACVDGRSVRGWSLRGNWTGQLARQARQARRQDVSSFEHQFATCMSPFHRVHVDSCGVEHVNSGGAVVHRNSCTSNGAEVRERTKPSKYEYMVHG